VTVCDRCRQGWQEGGGARIAIDAAAVDRALCDAQHIGSIDGDGPQRAHQDIPPSVARFVWRRDGGRCRVDGCRSSRGLELHHLVHRAHGGGHGASNIVLICSACHVAHHRGVLTLSGTSENLHVRRPGGTAANAGPERVKTGKTPARETRVSAGSQPQDVSSDIADPDAHVDAMRSAGAVGDARACARGGSKLDAAIVRAQAKAALTGLGWKPAIAQAAVAGAVEVQGAGVTLERLIFEALRRCPTPGA
jgi:hypothetical protein